MGTAADQLAKQIRREAQQRYLLGPARLYLRSVRHECRAVGYVEAEPRVKLEAADLSAQALSEQITTEATHLALQQGRVAVSVLRQAGLAGFGRASDGTSLAPFPLSPEAVLWHDFTHVPGPWQRIIPLTVTPSAAGTRSQNAYNHFEWLRTWGFSGGIQGTVTEVGAPLVRWLKDYLGRVQQAQVLVVGTTTVQNYMFRLADGEQVCHFSGAEQSQPAKLNFITPEQLEAAPLLAQTTDWDIVCLINMDMFLASKYAKLIDILHSLPRALFIGLFTEVSFKEKDEAREYCARLLGLRAVGPTHSIWRYLLRNPREPAKELPQPPPDTEEKTATEAQQGSPGLAPYSFELRSFLGNAERLSNVTSKAAPFFAYYNQRPSYGNMDKRQLAWYLYWRQEVRHGRYLDTGLDYIRLLALELINGYGVPDQLAGYEQLSDLWLHYREQYPSLDNWLPEWLCDYLLVNGSPLDPLTPLQRAVKLGVPSHYPDLLLENIQRQGWLQVPFSLLEQIAHTSLHGSSVYSTADCTQIASAVLRALASIDNVWRKEDGRGILARLRPRQALPIKRLPFTNVLFARSTRLLYFGRYYPYSRHPPFISLLQGLIKQTENMLRIERGYRGRVRGVNLPDSLPTLVERSFQKAMPKAKVTIDTKRVAILTQQSDEVRDLLLAETGVGRKDFALNESKGDGDGLPKVGLISDVDRAEMLSRPDRTRRGSYEGYSQSQEGATRYSRLATRLGKQELRALTLLLQPEGWQQLVQECQLKVIMPEMLLDSINDSALEVINDLLIDTTTSIPAIREEYLQEVKIMLKQLRT